MSANYKIANVDFFLYSCLESESTLAARSKEYQLEKRFPLVSGFQRGEALPENIKDLKLDDILSQTFLWHKNTSPDITDADPVYLRDLHIFSPNIVCLIKDIQSAIEASTSQRIPLIPNKYKEEELDEVWKLLFGLIEEHCGAIKKDYIKAYLVWSYSKWSDERVEVGDRPPVGKFMPYTPFNKRHGNKGPGGPRSGPGDRNHRGGGAPDKRKSKDFGGNSSYPPKNRDNRGPSRSNNDRPNKSSNNNAEEAESLKAVQESIQKLKKDNLSELVLPPANSYFRRLQHKQIKQEGFNSESVGEGSERAVVIKK